jgi:hypothetical protein
MSCVEAQGDGNFKAYSGAIRALPEPSDIRWRASAQIRKVAP